MRKHLGVHGPFHMRMGLSFLLSAVQPFAAFDTPRERLFRVVAEHPGLTLGQLRAGAQMSWGAAYYHSQRLAHDGRIRIITAGRRRLHVPCAREFTETVVRARGLLQGETVRQVCAFVSRNPLTDIRSICASTGLSPRAVYYHVRQLLDNGLLESRGLTHHFGLRVTALYAAATAHTADILGR